jgi:hypothetical protein
LQTILGDNTSKGVVADAFTKELHCAKFQFNRKRRRDFIVVKGIPGYHTR